MAALLSWTRPKTASDWEWQEARRQFWQAARFNTLITVLIGLLALCIAYLFFPNHFDRAVQFVVTGVVLGVIQPCATHLLSFGSYEEYEVQSEGVHVGPGKGKLYRWRVMLGYRLTEHRELPGMRCLELTVGKLKVGVRCWFEPSQVDEARLLAVLQEKLPGKWLASTPEA